MNLPTGDTPLKPWRTSARRGTLSVVLWAFGLATTLLLLGLWGRAITHDQPTVQASVRAVVDAGVATDRIYAWIAEGVTTSSHVDDATAEQVVIDLREHPEIEAAVGSVIDQFVAALFTPEGEVATVELAGSLEPVLPLVLAGLAARDVSVDESALTAALENAETIDLGTGDAATIIDVVEDARSLLSLIVVLSGATLLLAGSLAIWLSEDGPEMVRRLATRILISALSFAVLFRVGSWALDPKRGGSPIAGGGSILLGSNGTVFIFVAVVAASVVGGVVWLVQRRTDRSRNEHTRIAESDADTRELVGI
ncbi:MAG: hypothetical protein V3S28_05715 [Acidimicrobiia bacterium]